MPHGFWGVAGVFGIIFMVMIGIILLYMVVFGIAYWLDIRDTKRAQAKVKVFVKESEKRIDERRSEDRREIDKKVKEFAGTISDEDDGEY